MVLVASQRAVPPPPPESPDEISPAVRTRLARDRDLLWRVLVPLKGPRSLLGFVGRVAFGVACFLYFYRFPSAMDPSQPAQGPQPQPDANDVFHTTDKVLADKLQFIEEVGCSSAREDASSAGSGMRLTRMGSYRLASGTGAAYGCASRDTTRGHRARTNFRGFRAVGWQ